MGGRRPPASPPHYTPVTHPGTNRARRALTSFMRRTPLTTTPRCGRHALTSGHHALIDMDSSVESSEPVQLTRVVWRGNTQVAVWWKRLCDGAARSDGGIAERARRGCNHRGTRGKRSGRSVQRCCYPSPDESRTSRGRVRAGGAL